jgi:c-di-GMP-binding flagellar brake protein YcgR
VGTDLLLRQFEPPLKLVVLDFSLGGLLCVVESARERVKKNLMLTRGRRLKNLELYFREENVTTKIRIGEATIVRVETNPVTRYRQYAFQFNRLDKGEEKSLTKVLYGMQRKFLRQRLPLKD